MILLSGCAAIREATNSPPPSPETLQKEREKERARVIGLASIKTIYLGDFGTVDGADLVREKIRLRLSQEPRFEVVENLKIADAIMTGVAGVEKNYSQNNGSGGTNYAGLGVLRIVDVKKQKTIWNFEYQRSISFGVSVSSKVAIQVVDQLISDAEKADSFSVVKHLDADTK